MDVAASGRDRADPFQTGRKRLGGDKCDRGEDNAGPASQLQEAAWMDWSLLGSLTGLVIRSVECQVSLMISLVKFPPWLIYSCLIFVLDPYRTTRRGRRYLMSRIVKVCDLGLKNHKPVVKLALGLSWAVFVSIVLFTLFVSAIMISGFVMALLAHEPLLIKESLNFDYTKNIPEAYVPITTSCTAAIDGFDLSCKESIRTHPPNHRTEITVSMTFPESEYNRNLGMFQVRVDFLSATGQMLATSRRPCMLKFRSGPIRLVQTLLKIVLLVTGYVSETQTLNLKLKGFDEEYIIPTAFLRIMIEQRAEFRLGGAGIPEIYDASLLLESKLPFFKKTIWNWRRTLFVWISMSMFIMELLFALLCFALLIIPRTGQRDTTPTINHNSGGK